MSKSLIFCAYAENENMQSGENVKKISNKRDLYLKNSFVALYSAKANHPEVDAALVTNAKIPIAFAKRFKENRIKIIYKEFDSFIFGGKVLWGLAFYKLCALKHIVSLDYENIIMVDTDVVIQRRMDDLLEEIKHSVFLYERFARSSYAEEISLDKEIRLLLNEERTVAKYGGEFIGGSKLLLKMFIKECDAVYSFMKRDEMYTNFGDEFILCIAAQRCRNIIREANAYIERFWTGTFRQVNINYLHNPVSILHVPAEKSDGMVKLYRYILNNNRLPKEKRMHRILHLDRPSPVTSIKIIGKKILGK